MRWFRDNGRQGSWLALIALAINLALSFGHFHASDGKVINAGLLAKVAAIATPESGSKPGHTNDGHADVLCPICVASAAMAHALASVPPALPVEFAVAVADPTIAPDFAVIQPRWTAFQSRGPPLS
jgi:Protein of unknown function (DUF2946)